MMTQINPSDFQRLLAKHNVSASHFFQACEMNNPQQLLSDDGYHVHPYIDRTIQAIAQQLPPMPSNDIKQLSVASICEILGVDELTVRQWINYGRFPRTVRLAMATCQQRYVVGYAPKDLSQSHRVKMLKNIELGEYCKSGPVWRSPPIMGKVLPRILNRTVDEMRLNRYLTVRHNILRLTRKSRRIIFNKR